MCNRLFSVVLLMTALLPGGAAFAQNTFLGTASNDWDTAANWSFGSIPGALDAALISAKSASKSGGTISTVSLSLNNGASLSLLGTTVLNTNVTFGNTGVSTASSSISVGYSGTGSCTINTGGTLSGNIGSLSGHTNNSAPTGSDTTLTNNGTIVSSFSGTTTQIGGISGNSNLNIVNNGTFQVINGASLSDSFSWITNNGIFSVSGGGNTTFYNSFTNNGSFNVNGGTLTIGSGNFTGSGTYNLTNAALAAIDGINGATFTGVTIHGTNSTITSLSGTFSGSTISGFSTANLNSGQLILENGSSFDASTIVLNGGSLILEGSANTLTATNYTFAGTSGTGSSLSIGYTGAGSFTINSGVTLSGNIGSLSGHTNSSSATGSDAILTNNGTITSNIAGTTTTIGGEYTALNIVNNGTFQATNGASVTDYFSPITNNGTFSVSGGGNTTFYNSFANNGSFNVNGGILTIGSGNFTGNSTYNLANTALAVTGGINGATFTGVSIRGINSTISSLSGTFNGSTITGFPVANINSGQLTLENGSSIDASTIVINGGFLVLEGSTNNLAATNYNFTGSGGSLNIGYSGAGSFTVNSGVTLSGNISGLYGHTNNSAPTGSDATLTNNGTITSNVSGTNTTIGGEYTALNLVNNGTLQVTNGANLTSYSGAFTNNGTFRIGNGSSASFYNSLTQTGGSMTVDGAMVVSSGITINLQGGTLNGTASIGGTGATLNNTGATVSAGDSGVGAFTINGAYKQSGIGSLLVDLGGTSTGTFDVINVNGIATLGGKLYVDLLSGFTPTLGQTFTFMNYSSRGGSGVFTVDSLNSGYDYSVSYGANSATLMVTKAISGAAAPEPAGLLLIGIGLPITIQGYRRRKSITRTR